MIRTKLDILEHMDIPSDFNLLSVWLNIQHGSTFFKLISLAWCTWSLPAVFSTFYMFVVVDIIKSKRQ